VEAAKTRAAAYNALPFFPAAFMEQLITYVTHHPLLAGAALVALVAVVVYESRARLGSESALSSQELVRLMNQGALVLDIRKPDEFAAGHVNGAKHLPSDQILTASDSFKRFKEKPVIVVCDSGSLAAAAVRNLQTQGFTKAFLLRGGLNAWRSENLPIAKGA
jgi:rhodanese-related sulfurtransferase